MQRSDHGKLRPQGDGIWSISHDLRLAGVNLGRRMVAVESQGKAILFSPTPEAKEVITERLGNVSTLVMPNLFHDTWFPEARQRWAGAKALTPEDKILSKQGPDPEILRPIFLAGMPRFQETVFFHEPSGALIVSDLFFYYPEIHGAWPNLMLRLNDAWKVPRATRLFRSMIRDRDAFRSSLEEIMEFPVQRIIPAHGEPISSAREALEHLHQQLS